MRPPDQQTLKNADQKQQFFHFTNYRFLRPHPDGGKRKISTIEPQRGKTNNVDSDQV